MSRKNGLVRISVPKEAVPMVTIPLRKYNSLVYSDILFKMIGKDVAFNAATKPDETYSWVDHDFVKKLTGVAYCSMEEEDEDEQEEPAGFDPDAACEPDAVPEKEADENPQAEEDQAPECGAIAEIEHLQRDNEKLHKFVTEQAMRWDKLWNDYQNVKQFIADSPAISNEDKAKLGIYQN